jgi:MoxR-like ATPase
MEENKNEEFNIPQQSDSENTATHADDSIMNPMDVQKEVAPELVALTSKVHSTAENIIHEISKVVIGQERTVELLFAALLTGGHVLIEGYPGIAKTLTAKTLAQTIKAKYSRIQFTPDLMPTDITGTSIFNMKESNFYFRKGPLFSNIILIDEINRAPAKTQAALMEVMEEKQITYDSETYRMEYPFFVVATQNPIEQEGTYSLPEAQLDRFMFRIKLGYPNLEDEQKILHRYHGDFDKKVSQDVQPVISPEDLKTYQDIIEKVEIRPELLDYIAAIVHNTRNNGDLFLGASPRASLAMMKTSKALAAMRNRFFVTPDDIKDAAVAVLNHRIVMSHEREMEGHTVEEIIEDILKKVEVPR